MASNSRARRKNNVTSSALLNALNFVSVAQKEKSDVAYQCHCRIENNCIVATNGTLTLGCKIEEDIIASPYTFKLKDALSLCGEALSITLLDNERLSIKSGKFSPIIPCTVEPLPLCVPDPSCGIIDNRIKEGFEAIGVLIKDETQGDTVSKVSLLIRSGSMVATNHFVLLEYWHGLDLPPNLIVPKAFVKAVLSTDKKLVKFGFSYNKSLTFYFEDDSFIKTQLYENEWPNVDALLNKPSNCWPLPVDFFKAVDAVEKFSAERRVYFCENLLASSDDPNTRTTYEVEGLPHGPVFNAILLKQIKNHIEKIDFTTYKECALFFGPNIRGAIAGCRR